ncbi:histidine kinase [Microbacterium sp. GXF7504]
MTTGIAERLAGVLVTLEGIGVGALAVWQVVELIAGNTDSVTSALALLVLTVVGAAIVIAFGLGTLRDQGWARSGGIVTQLLILAVAGGAATGAYAHPAIGAALAVPAIVVLVLLIAAVSAAGKRRPRSAGRTGDVPDA